MSTLSESPCRAGAAVLTAQLGSQYPGVGENMLFSGMVVSAFRIDSL